jgi:ornithine cyclodeaminase/alanine dehydrogenase-like protein (mu-crystallin family)
VALPVMDAAALARALPMAGAIDALEAGFRRPLATGPLRTHVDTAPGSLLVMPATGESGTGVKLVTLTPGNPAAGRPLIHAMYVLFDPVTQAPRAVLDGGALTALRTGAVSGLATRFLARPDASELAVFGAGVQARSHVTAMRAVRPIARVTVIGRDADRASGFVTELRADGLDAATGDATAVETADIVCTCTTSDTPLFDGNRLRGGAHVNAVGAYLPTTRELDTAAVARGRVVVETREVAMAEAGTILLPIAEGAVGPDHVVADLAEVVGGAAVRRGAADVTVFVSVGAAFEDLIVAAAAVGA